MRLPPLLPHYRTLSVAMLTVLVAVPAPGAAQSVEPDRDATRADPTVPEMDGDQPGWSFTLGLGGALEPEYEGGEDLEVGPLPIVEARWRSSTRWGTSLFAGTLDGVGVSVLDTDRYALGVSGFYDGGRDESDGNRLRGLGDIDSSVSGTAVGELRLEPFALSADVSHFFGGSDGTLVTLGGGAELPLGERLSLTAGLAAAFADSSYIDEYFGVTRAQARRSRARLRRYDADAGLKNVDATIEASYAVSPSWIVTASGGVSRLVGDAADSPVVERKTQPILSLAVIYRF